MNRLNDLRTAADSAAANASQKIDKINTRQFQNLISELQSCGVDSTVISQLEVTIGDTTLRNKLVVELVEKGGSISKQIMTILNKYV
jgi:thiamine biosynthesis protein ThiC